MEQFSLDKWLQDKSRKVITRDGREVEILKTNCKGKIPMIVLYDDNDVRWVTANGKIKDNQDTCSDLFFADEEEELTEFEKELQIIISEASHWTSDDGNISTYCQFGDKEIKKISGQLLDLARKELQPEFNDSAMYRSGYEQGKQDALKVKVALKSLPKWKRVPKRWKVEDNVEVVFSEDYKYYIDKKELFNKLPKE